MLERINEDYFEWMCDIVCKGRYAKSISFRKLLAHLHRIEFTFIVPRDKYRAKDGVNLRYRFALSQDSNTLHRYLEGPCSVLEMLIALSMKCEEQIMDNPELGNRTGQWFWNMITNLGLGSMINKHFDVEYVDDVIARFLNREYSPDGRGGLFTIRNCDTDLRDVEIWYQLCWYLDSIT